MVAEDKDYLIKREKLRPLQLLKGERPFTEEEMKTLRESVRDMSDFRLRCRALTALSYIQDPQQRKEAIELAIERLKDPEWVVRQYALWALGNLDAKESIPQILPLLNDPNPMVRKQAKKTLQKLGYQVRE
jgi:vesicle coat complex subunit